MNRQVFYDTIRGSLFGGSLSQRQVDGIDAVLDAGDYYAVSDIDHVAFVLANVHRETGGGMYPVKETVYAHSKDKNPSDTTVKQRLTTAYNKGQLPWVKKPYWSDGGFGRGQIQLTHWDNYSRVGALIGVDLRNNPAFALDPIISGRIAVLGMVTGVFTGKKLSDYRFPEDTEAPVAHNPRRIVNGNDGSDKEVAGYYRKYREALLRGALATPATPPATPEPVEIPSPEAYTPSVWDRVILFFARLFGH